jgi:predicted metal-dependent peptidase
MSQGALNAGAAELQSIVDELHPEAVEVIYCDTRVRNTRVFTDGEQLVLEARGRGGTRFNPVFEYINGQEEKPVCLIYFTDLDCSDQPEEPDYPVLWVTDEQTTTVGPFGETVRVTPWD